MGCPDLLHAVNHPMSTMRRHLECLSLLIERIQDAELLLDAEGARLRTQTEATRQALEAGDAEAARRHIEQIARFAESLITTRTLSPADGHAVIEKARRILASDTD